MPPAVLHSIGCAGTSCSTRVSVAPAAKHFPAPIKTCQRLQLCSRLLQAVPDNSPQSGGSRDIKSSQDLGTQQGVGEDAYDEEDDDDAVPSTSTSSSLASNPSIRRRFARGRRASSRQSRAQGRGQESPGLQQRRQQPRTMPVQIPIPAGRLYNPPLPGSEEDYDSELGGGASSSSFLPEAQALEKLAAGADPRVRAALQSMAAASVSADMEQQLAELSPQQMKALMAAARDAQATGNVGYWERTLLRPLMHLQLKQDLGPEMSSLLDALVDDDEAVTLGDSRVSGSRRRGGGGGPSSGVMRRRLDQLTPEQRQRLPQLLSELEELRDATALLGRLQDVEEEEAAHRAWVSAARLNRLAKSKGLTPPSLVEAEEEEEVSHASSTSGGGGYNPQQQQAAAAGGQDLRQVALQAGLDTSTADLVTRLDAVYKRYNPDSGVGWEQEGYLGSPELRSLKRAALTLRSAADIQTPEDMQARGVSAAQLAAAVEGAMQEFEDLMEADAQGALALDPVIRSSLLFLRTHLATPPAAQGEEGGGGGAGSGPEEGELELPIEPERLDKLLTFIPAAEAWEALHALAASWEGRHPGVAFSEARKSSPHLGGPGELYWWVADRQQVEQEQQQAPSSSAPARPHLAADWDRIQALSALDASLLRAIDELDAAGYSDEVVMKWSLHPVVGPRLTSGQALLDLKELPQEWRELWEAGNAWEWPGIEYRWEERPVTDPVALAQAQRLVAQHPEPRVGRLATGLKRELLSEFRRQRYGSKPKE